MDLHSDLKISQKQMLTHEQIQAIEILEMDSQELQEYLLNEFLENPMIEQINPGTSAVSFPSGSVFSQDCEMDLANMAAPEKDTVKTALLEQLNPFQYSGQEMEAIKYLIDNLDKNGYLYMPTTTGIVRETARQFRITEQAVERLIADLKGLEPAGIFAANMEECLLLQAKGLGIYDDITAELLHSWMKEIGAGQLGTISRAMKIHTSVLRQHIAAISRLHPYPLLALSDDSKNYVLPDIILTKENGRWKIDIRNEWNENYRLNDYYIRMMEQNSDAELTAYFQQKLERARMVQANLERRQQTLSGIVQVIVDYQSSFFDKTGYLKPMTLEYVAQMLEINRSTVSRGIKGKYIQYPSGVISMKKLFSTTVTSTGTGSKAEDEVKSRLRELIEREDKSDPYSDMELCGLLKDCGMELSRRTIAKYRSQLGIPVSYVRKR